MVEDFLASKAGSSLSTMDTYRWILKAFAKWHGSIDIDRKAYDHYLLAMKRKNRSPNGIATAASVLREYAKFRGVTKDELEAWQKPRSFPVPIEYLKDEDIARLRRAALQARKPDEEIFVLDFLLGTSIRATEFVRLKWTDVDLENHTVTVRFGKENKSRIVKMTRDAYVALMRWMAHVHGSEDPSDVVLQEERISPVGSRQAVWAILDRMATRAGIAVRHVHPHKLRHTFAVMVTKRRLLSERGLQMQMGHASMNTTARYQQFSLLEDAKDLEAADLFPEGESRGRVQRPK